MKLYICNAFSLSMLNPEHQLATNKGKLLGDQVVFPRTPVPLKDRIVNEYVRALHKGGWQLVSAVGHADTAKLFSDLLNIEIPVNRISVRLDNYRDVAIIGQLIGPRLPEGCTTLPDGATIQWWKV